MKAQHYWAFMAGGFPSQRTSNVENVSMSWPPCSVVPRFDYIKSIVMSRALGDEHLKGGNNQGIDLIWELWLLLISYMQQMIATHAIKSHWDAQIFDKKFTTSSEFVVIPLITRNLRELGKHTYHKVHGSRMSMTLVHGFDKVRPMIYGIIIFNSQW